MMLCLRCMLLGTFCRREFFVDVLIELFLMSLGGGQI